MSFARHSRRLFFSVFAIGVIYANLAAFTQSTLLPRKMSSLPFPGPLANIFLIHGVFGILATNATQHTIWGLPASAQGDTNQWKQLPTREYFPFGQGECISRMG